MFMGWWQLGSVWETDYTNFYGESIWKVIVGILLQFCEVCSNSHDLPNSGILSVKLLVQNSAQDYW